MFLDMTYPVGAIYMSVNSTSPATLFGGTWEAIQGRFLIGTNSTYTPGSTGGEATHTLTVSEMPKHYHRGLFWSQPDSAVWNVTLDNGTYAYRLSWSGRGGSSTDGAGLKDEYQFCTGQTGSSSPHNNMPPYLAVYMWKRIA